MSKYSSHEILWSDHRPVSASAIVDVRVVDEEKRKAELSIVQGELDKLEEEWAPSLSVDSQELDFGEIK
jgi:phosphatidylinositol-bisphosphatase